MVIDQTWDWFIFNVFIPLLSIPLVWAGVMLVGKRRSLFYIIRDGQLCFFSTVTISVFLRDMINHQIPAIGFAIGLGLLMVFSMFVYGVAVINDEYDGPKNAPRIGWTSVCIAVMTVALTYIARKKYGIL